jgi:hypothetical protein
MDDLTVIFLTVNRVPKKWAEFHRSVLEKAIGDTPVISISKEPLDFGTNIIQTEPESTSNIYFQLLKGAKLATTPFIAVAEDDTLYPAEHFTFRHHRTDAVYYDLSRWVLNIALDKHFYYQWPSLVNTSMIGPRTYIIEALEERFAKYPNGTPDDSTGEIGKWDKEGQLGLTPRSKITYKADKPFIHFKHNYRGRGMGDVNTTKSGLTRETNLPDWGNVEDLISKFI